METMPLPLEVEPVDVRRCNKCGEHRPPEMFYEEYERRERERTGNQRFTMHCRLCQRNKNQGARKDRRDHLDTIKLTAGCTDCGLKIAHPEVYDFDHRDPEAKVATISQLFNSGTWEQLLAEISKCDVVCANCHRIRTKERRCVSFGRDLGPRGRNGS